MASEIYIYPDRYPTTALAKRASIPIIDPRKVTVYRIG